jgi:hypothetical protein
VGCQNYDDQFDDLNAQISALKSQVDGLGSLSGQVSSLSGTISGLQAGITAAQAAATAAGTSATAAAAAANAIDLTGLSAGLTTLQAEVDAVQASLATAATATAVAALQSELDAIEADVTELLTTSNIYSTAVTVNSVSTLDAALALGNKLNILNNTATITVSTSMDQTKVQTLVNRINTMTGKMTFNSSATVETTFEKLTSVADLEVNQKGGYNFKNLISAGAVVLNDQYEANISVIDFRSLASVTSFATATASDDTAGANTIDFNQATELHLTSMARYPGATLTIVTKKGATLAMGILDDKDANGTYEATALTITGPAAFTTTLMTDGTMEFTNVASVNVTGYRGGITLNAGVETFNGQDITEVTVAAAADDLTSFTAKMKRDDNPSLSTTATAALEYDTSSNLGDIDLSGGLANLATVNVSGKSGDITISDAPNLTGVTVSADAFDFVMDNNDNLTSVTVTGAKFHDVSVTGMADLATLVLNHTTKLPEVSTTASADETGASMTVTGNASLASLTMGADDIDNLAVNTNPALATVDFTGLSDDGSSTVTSAAVYNNNLKATLFKDTYNTGATAAIYTQYTSTDTGSIASTSGIATLKTWLDNTVAAASATGGIYVFMDQIDKYEVQASLNGVYTDTAVPAAPAVTTEATANGAKTSIYAIVAKQGAESAADTGVSRSETITQTFPITNNAIYAPTTLLTASEGFAINVGGLSKSFMNGDSYTGAANGSTVTTVADMIGLINADTSWSGVGITVTASNSGYLRSLQRVNYTDDLGGAQTISVAGTIWYKLGSSTASGATAAFTAGEGAAEIATEVTRLIEAHTHPVTGASLYNAHANGAIMEIRQAISASGYADDVTVDASIPTVSFVIDAAMTSTTAKLGEGDAEDINAYSGSVANAAVSNTAIQGQSEGFNLSVDKFDINGISFKLVNSSTAITRLSIAGTTLPVLHRPGNAKAGGTSPTIGALGLKGSVSQTKRIGYGIATAIGKDLTFDSDTSMAVSSTLISGTHFVVTAAGGVNNYATTFAQISSVTAGAVTQAAAVTDRTGWL